MSENLELFTMLLDSGELRYQGGAYMAPRMVASGDALVYLAKTAGAEPSRLANDGEQLVSTQGLKDLLGADWQEFCLKVMARDVAARRSRG